ncbi:MAG TPA: PTS sugar transporter subunit IIA [Candidatus Wallbacteria bacterium]|nr:PTS sugar transporter subunit IIA [Candidatus Wallbacteria bacterium]HPG56868.1 PTS sugar transporter subunit IIA [Candidatus Wallbacteria bacterium]
MPSIAKLLKPKLITLNIKAAEKSAAISSLCELISQNNKCDAEALFNTIMNRESLQSTAVGHGVALPHARCDVDDFIVAAAVSEKGMDFNSIDKLPVNIVFLIISPKNETSSYLQTLSQIAALLSNEKIRSELVSAKTPEEFIEIVKNNERR